jgi:hypothetical protein
MSFGNMDDYSLSDLAGSGAIILASIGGLLTIILSSRCYIKCRLGLTDNCNICMCERKPPPDPEDPDDPKKKKKDKTPTPDMTRPAPSPAPTPAPTPAPSPAPTPRTSADSLPSNPSLP